MNEQTSALTSSSFGRAQSIVRRVIVFTILFALVVIVAIGLSVLIDRAIGGPEFVSSTDSSLALSLAFVFIGAPLTAVLWWWERRRVATDVDERSSLGWALYATGMSVTSLIVAVVSLGGAASSAVEGEWNSGALAAGVVWTGVWLWHRHIRTTTVTAPTRLVGVADLLGAVFGLAVAASAAVSALSVLIAQVVEGGSAQLVGSSQWVEALLQSLIWCAVGALVWWWHWTRERAKDAVSAFATVVLVVILGVAAGTTLFATGTVIWVGLRLLLDTDPRVEILTPLDVAIGAALIGGIVWVYHARLLSARPLAARRAGRLVVSAVALIGAASGLGVIINALLMTVGGQLISGDPRTLLLGGVSALVVGAPAWFVTWRPDRVVPDDQATDPARRVYLVAIFGASAIVGIITLLIIGYRLFEFGLYQGSGAALVERIRAPLGLLVATGLVFGYHFTVWRADRRRAGTVQKRQTIGRVILITSDDDADELAATVRAQTGAPVAVWRATDDAARFGDEGTTRVLEALDGVSARRVLVIAEAGGGVRVVPLAE